MENDIELLKAQLEDLKSATSNIIEAMTNIGSFNELEEAYKSLDLVLYDIEDITTKYEVEIENLEEEAYYKENEEQWKKEKRAEENEYWRDKI